MKTFPSHVAILVPSVRKASEHLRRFDFQIGPEEVWDGEGTVGDGIAIPIASDLTHLVQHIGLEKIVKHSGSAFISVDGKVIFLKDLFNG